MQNIRKQHEEDAKRRREKQKAELEIEKQEAERYERDIED